MLFAADYPFLNILWSMIIFFAWVAWIWTLILIFGDLFRRHDSSGWVKAGWTIFLILIPFLGVLVYLIANARGMAERSASACQASQAHFDQYVESVATTAGRERDRRGQEAAHSGAITPAEFDQLKAKALA